MFADASRGLGGAAQFLRSLVEEVIPVIEARYRVHPTDSTLIGISLSGLFGLYVLFHGPQAFPRYLLVSPAIWWDETICLSYEQAWPEQHKDRSARVFCAVGETEEIPARRWPPLMEEEAIRLGRMVSGLQELTGRLRDRGYLNLEIDTVVFPDEHHIKVPPAAVSRGLLWLFVSTDKQ